MNKIEMILLYEKFINEYHDRIVSYQNSMQIPIFDRIKLSDLYTKISNHIKILIDPLTDDYVVETVSDIMIEDMNKIKNILGTHYLSSKLKEILSLPDVVTRSNGRYNFYIEKSLIDVTMHKKTKIPFAIAGDNTSYKFNFPINEKDDRSVLIDIAIIPVDGSEYIIDVFFHIPTYNKIDIDKIKGAIVIGNRHHEYKSVYNKYFFDKSPNHLDYTVYKQKNMARFKYCKYGSEYLEIKLSDENIDTNLCIRSITIQDTDKRSDNDVSFIDIISPKNITI